MKYMCPYCDLIFELYDEMVQHSDKCKENPFKNKKKEEIKKEEKLPYKYDQSNDEIDTSVLYTESDTTIADLVDKYGYPIAMNHEGAYRKGIDDCPHCGFEMDVDEWAKPPHIKEICVADDNYTIDNFDENMLMVVSECPKCGKRSICHYMYYTLLKYSWTDHKKIIKWMKTRGVEIK